MKITDKNVQLLGSKINSIKPKTLDELYKTVFDTEIKLIYGCGPEYEIGNQDVANKIVSFNIFNSTGKKFVIKLETPIYLTD